MGELAYAVNDYTRALHKAKVPPRAFHMLDQHRPKTAAEAAALKGVGALAINRMVDAGLLVRGEYALPQPKLEQDPERVAFIRAQAQLLLASHHHSMRRQPEVQAECWRVAVSMWDAKPEGV